MRSFDHIPEGIPDPIVGKLHDLVIRVRRVVWIRGGLAVAAVMLITILVAMGLDAVVTIFSGGLRWLIFLSWALLSSCAAYHFLYRPLTRRYSITRIARLIETRHPELEERISSAVQLSGDGGPLRGSEQLIDALVKEAVVDAGKVNPDREFTLRSARPYMITAAAGALVLLLLFAIWPSHTTRLFVRVLIPVVEVGNIQGLSLDVTPGDINTAAGESVEIELAVPDPRIGRAEFFKKNPDGIETRERMSRTAASDDEKSRFSIRFPSVTESFRYRVKCGSALSGYYTVNVIEKPEIESIAVSYDYPKYTGLPDRTVALSNAGISAIAGTGVTIAATLNRAADAFLLLNGQKTAEPRFAEKEDKPVASWNLKLRPGTAGTWSIRLKEEHGIQNEEKEYGLKAIADRLPSVQIVEPQSRTLKLRPSEALDIHGVARDDFGIARLVMMVGIDRGEMQAEGQPLPVRAEEEGIWQGQARLNLGELPLSRARQVKVLLKVLDNLPKELGGPQTGLSQVITIQLDHESEMLAKRAEEGRKTVAALKDLSERQEELKEEAQEIARQDDEKALEEWKKEQEKIAKDLAEMVKEDPEALEKQMRKDQETAEKLSAAANKLAEEQKRLQEMLRDLQQPGKREEVREKLTEAVAKKESEIAMESGELEKGESDQEKRKKIEDIKDRLKDVVGKLQEQQLGAAVKGAKEARQEMEQFAGQQQAESQPGAQQQSPQNPPQGEAGEQASRNPTDMKEDMAGLAGKQEQVERQLEAIERDDLESVLAELQKRLAEETEELAESVQGLQEKAEALGLAQQTQEDAQKALEEFEKAARGAAEADRQLARLDSEQEQPGENQGQNAANQGERQQQPAEQEPQ
ncbi:MAG: hypothetical protein QF437_09630, partial [Planctomycetota bacterium]|nr:hypothetical protein [Planctomycetota bacterium]